MSTPYYTRDGVPLKFTVSDENGVVNITSSKVVILKPHNEAVDGVDAAVNGNEVSYNVPGSVTTISGTYRAYFVCILPSGSERTHQITFEIKRNPGE